MAERAGIPEDELVTKRSALKESALTRLAQAKAAVQTAHTAPAIEELAHAISAGRVFALDEAELESAKKVYETEMDGNFTAETISYREHAVAFADHAGASVPSKLLEQTSTLARLRAAVADMQDKSLPQLLALIREATTIELPSTPELVAVESEAQTRASAQLQMHLAGECKDTLAEAIDSAVQAGVNQAALTAAQAVLLAR